MKKSIPERFHPGEYLREELQARTEDEILYIASRVGNTKLLLMLSGHRQISMATARILGYELGTGKRVWLNLQKAYDEGDSGFIS